MTRRDGSVVFRSVTRFLVVGLGVLLLLTVGAFVFASNLALNDGLDRAEDRTRTIADLVAAPLVTDPLRAGDPRARARLKTALDTYVDTDRIRHMLVYDGDGTVLWADDPALVATRVDLDPEVDALFGTTASRPERPGESRNHPGRRPTEDDLIEVYVGADGQDGQPFVFEAYLTPGDIDMERREVLAKVVPLIVGAMALFLLAMLPQAVSLARRVDRTASQRSELLRRSLLAWHEDRSRLANELHDGVVQDLAAMSYSMPVVIDKVAEHEPDGVAHRTAVSIGGLLQQGIHELRTVVNDLFLDDLHDDGLLDAVRALAARATSRTPGLEVEIAAEPGLGLEPASAGLAYRVVREGLNNVVRHARARRAVVRMTRDGDAVVVSVTDDGVGLEVSPPTSSAVSLGLRILTRQLEDVGASLLLTDAAEGTGAVLTTRIPADLS